MRQRSGQARVSDGRWREQLGQVGVGRTPGFVVDVLARPGPVQETVQARLARLTLVIDNDRGRVDHALLLEWLCGIFRDASLMGTPRALTEAEQTAVVEAAIARSYGSTQPARQSAAPGGGTTEGEP